MRILPEQVHSSKQQPLDKIFVLLSANFLFFGKNFLESLSPSRYSLHPGFRSASPGVIPSIASTRLKLGGTSPPGSAPLHLWLLMVLPVRGWGGPQVILAKQVAICSASPLYPKLPDRTAKETSRPDRASADNLIRQDNNPTKNQCSSVSIRG